MNEEIISPYLTVKDVMKYLKISRGTVNNYVKLGVIKKHRLYGQIRFKKDEIDASLKEVKVSYK